MIYLETRKFLQSTLGQLPDKDATLEENEIKHFFHSLRKKFESDYIEDNADEIIRAFENTFLHAGKVHLHLKVFEDIRFCILEYDTKPQQSKQVKELVDVILENKELIEYPYNKRNDQVMIPKELNHHLRFVISQSDERVNPKELLKHVLKKALNLENNDLVLFKKENIIIKTFSKVPSLNPHAEEPKPANKLERRFNGVDKEQLKNYCDELFSEKDFNFFLDSIVKATTKNGLNFKEVNYHYYEKYALRILIDTIKVELSAIIDDNEFFLDAFARYILREHFMHIHEIMAESIIELLILGDENVKNFLQSYSGSIQVVGSQKYILPEIIDSRGNRWNVSTITSISRQREKDKLNFISTENSMIELEDEYSLKDEAFLELDEDYQEYNKAFAEIESDINYYVNLRDKTRDELFVLRKSSRQEPHKIKELTATLNDIKHNLNELFEEKETLNKEYIKVENSYTKIKKELNTIKIQLNRGRATLQKLRSIYIGSENKYSNIIDGLATALTKRKKTL